MELGSDPAVFKEGDNSVMKAGWGEANEDDKGPTMIIAAVAIVVILAGGIVGALLYFKKTPSTGSG